MNDSGKSKDQLVEELRALRERVVRLEEQHATVQTLQDNAGYYDKMATSALDGFWVVGTDGGFGYVNDEACRMLGYTREEMLDLAIRDIEAKETTEEIQTHLRKVAANGYDRFDSEHRRKDGSFIHVEISTTFIPESKRILAFVRDLTERKRAEQALRDSEQRLRATFEQAVAGIAHVSVDGRWLQVNQRLCDIVGFSKEELLQRTFQDLTHPDDLQTDLLAVQKFISGEIAEYTGEKRYRRKNGSLVWVFIAVALVRDANGAPAYFVTVIEDITERRRMAKELARSEVRFRTLYETSSDAVMLLDPTGFFDCNAATVRLFGCRDTEEFCAQHPADLSPAQQPCGTDSMTLADQRIAMAMENGSLRFDWVHKRLDTGRSFPAEVLLSRMNLDGRPVLQATVRDVTERRQTEAEQDKLIGDLKAALAEVRTLSGLLPICAWCKCVRDDRGYWTQVESYVARHTNAQFTHGICPDCRRKLGE